MWTQQSASAQAISVRVGLVVEDIILLMTYIVRWVNGPGLSLVQDSGSLLMGEEDGNTDGAIEGMVVGIVVVVGVFVGESEETKVGLSERNSEGVNEGEETGAFVGDEVVVGAFVGTTEGEDVGALVEYTEGNNVGTSVGAGEGAQATFLCIQEDAW